MLEIVNTRVLLYREIFRNTAIYKRVFRRDRIMRDFACLRMFCMLFLVFLTVQSEDLAKDSVDRVIEDELTHKLSEDLLQSIERKFQVDLERSVDMVLVKIKLLLQNGTMHIQDRLAELQGQLGTIKKRHTDEVVETCLLARQNETTALAEKALHQMVVCGYALIGHDPAQAVRKVMVLRNMINTGLKPLHEQKADLYDLLKLCGHDHDSLKKVIKCVISKSPLIKSTMMDITGKLIDGVVTLTKLMAHGAMHEACLIEVIKTTEDEAFELVADVKRCAIGNNSFADEVDKFLSENNATVLDIGDKVGHKDQNTKKETDVTDMIRRVLDDSNSDIINNDLKEKLQKLQKDLSSNTNSLTNDVQSDK